MVYSSQDKMLAARCWRSVRSDRRSQPSLVTQYGFPTSAFEQMSHFIISVRRFQN